MKKRLLAVALLTLPMLNGCSTIMENLPWIYRIDIKQGNILDQDMINQLKPRMTKRQVLYVMGSPMLSDFFHKDRWDYIYSTREDDEQIIQKKVALFFTGDELVRVEGDYKPSQNAVAKSSPESSINVLPRKLDRTLWEKITGLFDWSNEDVPVLSPLPDESNNIPVKKF
jgi:outer membrane protein assembly factor BamE